MKYEATDSFKADYARLSTAEKQLFRDALAEFVAACDRYAADPTAKWPTKLRVKGVANAPGMWEMTWSFAGPDGRATFERIEVSESLAVRWRRIGGHSVFKGP